MNANHTSRPRFPPLPPHVDAADPRSLAWDIARTQEAVAEHEERIRALESRQGLPEFITSHFPWRQAATLAALLGLFLTGLLSGEQAKALGLKAFGIAWPH